MDAENQQLFPEKKDKTVELCENLQPRCEDSWLRIYFRTNIILITAQ